MTIDFCCEIDEKLAEAEREAEETDVRFTPAEIHEAMQEAIVTAMAAKREITS